MSDYLTEAFQKLRLVEDDFDLSADANKIDELKSFVADDIEVPEEEVIDVEAVSEDDLEDNYNGKVILECECCHSRIYKDKDEVFIDDESNTANIDEECPVCNNTLGYSVIGKIEPYEKAKEIEVNVNDEDEVEPELESLNKTYKGGIKIKEDLEEVKDDELPDDDIEVEEGCSEEKLEEAAGSIWDKLVMAYPELEEELNEDTVYDKIVNDHPEILDYEDTSRVAPKSNYKPYTKDLEPIDTNSAYGKLVKANPELQEEAESLEDQELQERIFGDGKKYNKNQLVITLEEYDVMPYSVNVGEVFLNNKKLFKLNYNWPVWGGRLSDKKKLAELQRGFATILNRDGKCDIAPKNEAAAYAMPDFHAKYSGTRKLSPGDTFEYGSYDFLVYWAKNNSFRAYITNYAKEIPYDSWVEGDSDIDRLKETLVRYAKQNKTFDNVTFTLAGSNNVEEACSKKAKKGSAWDKLKAKNPELKESVYKDLGSGIVEEGDTLTEADLEAYWDENCDTDPVLMEYDNYEEWAQDTIDNYLEEIPEVFDEGYRRSLKEDSYPERNGLWDPEPEELIDVLDTSFGNNESEVNIISTEPGKGYEKQIRNWANQNGLEVIDIYGQPGLDEEDMIELVDRINEAGPDTILFINGFDRINDQRVMNMMSDLINIHELRLDDEDLDADFLMTITLSETPKRYKESVEVTAKGEDNVNVSKNDDGSMDINVSSTEPGEGEEIVPLDDEEISEIEENEPEDEEEEEEIETEEGEEEAEGEEEETAEEGSEEEVGEFSEEEFDNMGESYMRKVYSNVKSYKTNSVATTGSDLIIEGIISFRSGAQKKTTFVLKDLGRNKHGKRIFEGYNKTFSNSSKAFRITGGVDKGRYYPRTFKYNYKTKTINESNKSEVFGVKGLIKAENCRVRHGR